jgi:hypothetical protein
MVSQLVWRTLGEEAVDSQNSYFVGQLRSLVAPTPSSAALPSSEETASHPDWLRTFTIFPTQRDQMTDYPDNDPDVFLVFPDAFGQNLANLIIWWENCLSSCKAWR